MSADVLALDFDGVICDSASECLFSAYAAYAKSTGLPEAEDLDAIPSEWRREFCRMRPFIRDGKDFLLILYFVHHRVTIEGQQDFDDQAAALMPEALKELLGEGAAAQDLEELFQGTRRVIRARDEAAWAAINPLYRGIEEGLRACRERADAIYVTTSKPSDAVLRILRHHGTPLPESQVFGSDRFKGHGNKNAHLEAVRDATDLPLDRIHYVEDQITHLIAAQALGARCYFAEWGYNTEEQKAQAIQAGIAVLEDREVPAWMLKTTKPGA